ncbi:hypothetical protein T4D_933 [Trichinella pseudospiralis]|uniref:Uncharacterized protein n=1 Tax=Trichinella pseudospiralis TaxID=6337 RepID=A0A0V1G4C3_TRIPS|nr:hypothetical protein T4D_933 [Trichinella pseudospiralis]
MALLCICGSLGKCGSEKSLLIIVSNEQKWLTRASKIIDVIGNANLIKNSSRKEKNLNIEDGLIPEHCLYGNEKIIEQTVEKSNDEALHCAIYLWKIQTLTKIILKIQSTTLPQVLQN